jgi:serine/threonine protein phosphatase PrpC
VEALVAAGHLTHEQAEDHPMKNVLYRALGQTEEIDVDVYEVRLHSGDRLVLCSDGLTRHVKPEEIAEIIFNHTDPSEAAQALINRANERGGEDNVSAVVIMVDSIQIVDEMQTLELKMVSPLLADDETLHLRLDEDTHRAIPILKKRDNPPESEGRDPRTPPQ